MTRFIQSSPDEQNPQTRRRKHNRRVAISLAMGLPVSAVLFVLIAATGLPRARWETWQKRREALIKDGKLPTYEALIPPSIPDDQNFAMIQEFVPLREFLALGPELRADGEPAPIVFPEIWGAATSGGKGLRDISAQTQRSADDLRDALAAGGCASPDGDAAFAILAALEGYQEMFTAIEAGTKRSSSRWPMRYDLGFAMAPSAWPSLRQITYLFAMRCLARRNAGMPAEAATDVVTLLGLGRALQRDPLLVSTMIGVAIERAALSEIWNGIASHAWPRSCLEMFRAELATYDEFGSWHRSITLEWVAGLRILESSVREERPIWGLRDDRSREEQWFGRWILNARHRMSIGPFAERLVETADSITITDGAFSRDDYNEWKERCEAYTKWNDPFLAGEIEGKERALVRVLNTVMYRRFATLACGLEDQFRATGEFPLKLAEAGDLSVDIANGEQVVYECAKDRRTYRMYSVGWDQVDDGGKSTKLEPPWTGDWVWSMPGFAASK